MTSYTIQNIINLETNKIIPVESIISIDKNGIVTKDTSGIAVLIDAGNVQLSLYDSIDTDEFTLIINSNLTLDNSSALKYNIKKIDKYEQTDDFSGNQADDTFDSVSSANPSDSYTTEDVRYYSYYFGLDDFKASRKKYYTDSGFISDEISVNVGDTISLKVDDTVDDNSCIEYSIIDGVVEYPILPNNNTTVVKEKLFFDMDTRFDVLSLIAIYKNNMIHTTDINAFDSLDFSGKENDYSISYITDGSYSTHTVKHDKIRIKAVLRMYDEDSVPPQIKSIILTAVSD